MSMNRSVVFHLIFSLCFLINFSNSFHIPCHFKNSDVGFGHFETCEPHVFDTSHDKYAESVISWPLTRSTEDFQQFYIEHLNAVYFPGHLEKFFPNLEVVKLWDSRVKYVENFDLRFLTKLKYLSLEDNAIEVLQTDLFYYNTELIEIHLQNNKIKFIGARLLVPLTKLKVANFKTNSCVDVSADSPDSLKALSKAIDENCSAPEFLARKNSEFIKKTVELNFTVDELKLKNENLLKEIKVANNSLSTCESDNDNLKAKAFKLDLSLKKESGSLKRANNELKNFKESNDELTIENVKLNNELKRVNLQTKYESTSGSCQSGSGDVNRLNFENSKLMKENQILKSFKEEVEKEWRAINLHCQFVQWRGYTCQTNDLRIKSDDSLIKNVNGRHEGKKTNFDVKNLLISSQDVRTTFLPINIGSIFPRLESLMAKDSKIVFIKRRNFDNLAKLGVLILDHNLIEEIVSDTFDDLENLIKLDLSFNRLMKIEKDTFKFLKKLKFLAMNNNQIEKLSASLFKYNLQLEVVLMENNKIKYIGSSILNNLPNLKFADLEKNECINGKFTEASISEVDIRISSHCSPPTDIFCSFEKTSAFYSCKVVDLVVENENTKVLEVQGSHQKGKSNDDVTELSIINQNIQFFPTGLAKFLKNLRRIFVKNSKLTVLDGSSFEQMTRAVQLILADNEICTVAENTFLKVKNSVEIIDLSNNKLAEIEPETFKGLIKLKVLKLNSNKLSSLSSSLLTDNISLEELHAKNNKLKSIGAYLMNNLRNVKLVDFTENICINQKFPLVPLQTLKLKILEQCK